MNMQLNQLRLPLTSAKSTMGMTNLNSKAHTVTIDHLIIFIPLVEKRMLINYSIFIDWVL